MNSLVADITERIPSLYSEEELSLLKKDIIPHHVAIMMDGNRRWARKKNLLPSLGHWKGAEILLKIVRAASQLGINTLTVFSFSTENWKRSSIEIKALMHLIKKNLIRQRDRMVKEGVKLETIGDLSKLPTDVQEEIQRTKLMTRDGDQIELILALNYGGRDEIKRAVTHVVKDCLDKKLDPETLCEEDIAKHLESAKWEDPSLIIRTSGEHRLSNFLLWQASYSEVLFTNVLWPDFNEKHLLNAVLEYQQRERRIGL